MRNYFKLLIVFILGKLKPKKRNKIAKIKSNPKLEANIDSKLFEMILESNKAKKAELENPDFMDAMRYALYSQCGTFKTDNQSKPNPTE